MRRTILILAAYFVGLGSCCGQTKETLTPTQWGPLVAGVQLAIGLTNTVIHLGSNVVLSTWIKNASTNTIGIGITGDPIYDLHVSLIETSGGVHDMTPKGPHAAEPNLVAGMFPNETNRVYITIRSLDSGLRPGSYRLRATRPFLPKTGNPAGPGDFRELVSNVLDVQIQ